VAACLLDVSILDNVDDVAASDGTQTVSNGDGRSRMEERVQLRIKSLGTIARTYRPLLALSSAICTDFSDCASRALVASASKL
jgi:hypothetical protein